MSRSSRDSHCSDPSLLLALAPYRVSAARRATVSDAVRVTSYRMRSPGLCGVTVRSVITPVNTVVLVGQWISRTGVPWWMPVARGSRASITRAVRVPTAALMAGPAVVTPRVMSILAHGPVMSCHWSEIVSPAFHARVSHVLRFHLSAHGRGTPVVHACRFHRS